MGHAVLCSFYLKKEDCPARVDTGAGVEFQDSATGSDLWGMRVERPRWEIMLPRLSTVSARLVG